MTYEHKNGFHYITNGESKIRCGLAMLMPNAVMRGRTCKVLHVLEILRQNPANPLVVGQYIAFSFPNDKLSATKYEWSKNGKFEECQVPFRLKSEVKIKTRQMVNS